MAVTQPGSGAAVTQGGQTLHATQKECRAQQKQMTAIGYIRDMDHIVVSSRLLFPLVGAAAFELSERSPLPPALPEKDLPGVQTTFLNVY